MVVVEVVKAKNILKVILKLCEGGSYHIISIAFD